MANEERKANSSGSPEKLEGERKMPCFRCGICCRYRICLSYDEVKCIVGYTRLERGKFVERYDEQGTFEEGYEDMYWFEADSYLMRQRDGICFFLEYISDKEAICRIHEVKPQVCLKYDPAPERPACKEGLTRFWNLTVSQEGKLEGTEEDLKAFCDFVA